MSPSRPSGPRLEDTPSRHPLLEKKRLLTGFLVAAALMLGTWLTSGAKPDHSQRDTPRTRQTFLHSPYFYVPFPPQMEAPTFASSVLRPVRSLLGLPGGDFPAGVQTLTLAFATGECGHERWDDLSAREMVERQLRKIQRAGIDYVISTGGADGVFSCSSEQGMEAFIARYESPHLLGLDFDIEAGQSEAIIDHLVDQVHGAAQRHPHLRMSFTLATASGTEPGRPALNAEGVQVMKSIQRVGLKNVYFNLMVMNFGEPKPGNCVVVGDRCDMAASAMATVRNFASEYGVPLHQIEITPMIGVNDSKANVFTLDDAHQLVRYVHDQGLGGLHFWSLNRDGVCPPGMPALSPSCHGLPDLSNLAFTQAFASGAP